MGLLQRIQKNSQNTHPTEQNTTENKNSQPPTGLGSELTSASQEVPHVKSPPAPTHKNQAFKKRLHTLILKEMKDQPLENIIPNIDEMAIEIIKEDPTLLVNVDRKKILDEIINNLTGYGPINPLLLDPDVSEVMVNGPHQVYAERKGKLELTSIQFQDHDHVMHVIEKIVSPLGRRIDESSPMVDARLPDGSRVNAIIPPLALNGPTITIRKFSKAGVDRGPQRSRRSATLYSGLYGWQAAPEGVDFLNRAASGI